MITRQHLREAINLHGFDGFGAQMAMAPAGREKLRPLVDKPPRPAAVLLLAYPDAAGVLQLVLTRRTDHLRGHSGQISFPGGKQDPDDLTYEDTALRETCEELGLCDRSQIQILGRLTPMWIPPSNFEVYPVVAYTAQLPQLFPSPDEVAAVLSLSLDALLLVATKRSTVMHLRGREWDVPYYDIGGEVCWGATAGMLSELEQRLRKVIS